MPKITVYRFSQAPEELRAVSTYGGDEDWLAEVPPTFVGEYVRWLEEGVFGNFVSTCPHPFKPGWEIVISAHA